MTQQTSLLNATSGDSSAILDTLRPVDDELSALDLPFCRDRVDRSATIMIVDDEPIHIKVVQKHLREAGYDSFVTTTDSRQALSMVRSERPDVVVLDIVMPHVSGLHLLEAIRGDIDLHHLPVLILTAVSDEETWLKSLELGATDLLTKPVRPSELIPRMRNALVLKSHHDHLAENSARLEKQVRQRTTELTQSRREVIHVLACAAEFRDQETGNHVLRVSRYCGILARQLGLGLTRAELIEQAAILHDVGKIGIPDAILFKPDRLDATEFAIIQQHCQFGQQILLGMRDGQGEGGPAMCDSPVVQMAATIAMSHHEKWDGSGYPLGLAGEAIPLEGRITAVADVFDALGARRPYKEPIPLDRCFEILEEGRGSHFDPRVLDAFFARVDEIIQVASELGSD